MTHAQAVVVQRDRSTGMSHLLEHLAPFRQELLVGRPRVVVGDDGHTGVARDLPRLGPGRQALGRHSGAVRQVCGVERPARRGPPCEIRLGAGVQTGRAAVDDHRPGALDRIGGERIDPVGVHTEVRRDVRLPRRVSAGPVRRCAAASADEPRGIGQGCSQRSGTPGLERVHALDRGLAPGGAVAAGGGRPAGPDQRDQIVSVHPAQQEQRERVAVHLRGDDVASSGRVFAGLGPVGTAAIGPHVRSVRQQLHVDGGRVLDHTREQFAVEQRRKVRGLRGDGVRELLPLARCELPDSDVDVVELAVLADHPRGDVAGSEEELTYRPLACVRPPAWQAALVARTGVFERVDPRSSPPGLAELRCGAHEASSEPSRTSSARSESLISVSHASPPPTTASASACF